MLETLGEPDIRKMSIEEPERESGGWFDSAIEVGELGISAIKREAREYLASDHMALFIKTVVILQELGIQFGISPPQLRRVEIEADVLRKRGEWLEFAKLIRNLRKLGLSEGVLLEADKKEIQKKFLLRTEKLNYMPRIILLNCLRDLDIEVEDHTDYQAKLQFVREHGSIRTFAELARLILEFGIDPKLTAEDIEKMKEDLPNRIGTQDFGRMAAAMKYLSDYGRQEPQALDQIPPLPTERKF